MDIATVDHKMDPSSVDFSTVDHKVDLPSMDNKVDPA